MSIEVVSVQISNRCPLKRSFFPYPQQAVNIEVTRVQIGDGCEFAVEEALHQAEKNDHWVVVEGLHLAPPEFFMTLRHHLQRIHKSRGQHYLTGWLGQHCRSGQVSPRTNRVTGGT